MVEIEVLAVVLVAYFCAGGVKGVIGLGMPTVSLAIMVTVIGLKDAIALMLLPAFATNVVQAVTGGAFAILWRRLTTLLIGVCIGLWFGVGVLAAADALLLSAILGGLLALYALFSLARPQLPEPGKAEAVLSPTVGLATGVVTGMTGSFVVPGVLYLQALRLPKDQFIQAMGIAFTVSAAAMSAAMLQRGLLTVEIGLLSVVALAPAFLGMYLGRRLRNRLDEALFRKVFFSALLVLGLYLIGRVIV